MESELARNNLTKIDTSEGCEQFARNVEAQLPQLAMTAKRKAVELRAKAHGAKSDVERESLEAIYAYERVLSVKRGKNIRASRTWQMIKRHGIIETMERVVSRDIDAAGYIALVEMGMKDLAFEAVVLRYPNHFSEKAVNRSRNRLEGDDCS